MVQGQSKTRLKILIAALCAVVAVAIFELGATLRLGSTFVRGRHVEEGWIAAARFDPELGWSNRPSATERIAWSTLDYEVNVNAAGFRDVERELEKPAGTKRVLLLGDSVTWGWGVGEEDRFGEMLDEQLGADVEVLNLACPGYGTDQQYWTLLERGLAYDPDVVVLSFVLNDVFEARYDERYGMNKPRFARTTEGSWAVQNRPVDAGPSSRRWLRSFGREVVARSALLSWATGRGDPARLGKPMPKVYKAHTAQALAPQHEAGEAIRDPESVTYYLLGLIAELCAEREITFITTLVPHKHDQFLYEPDFPRPPGIVAEGFKTHATGCLEDVGRAHGFTVVPVDAALLEATGAGTRLHVGDGHLNRAGHQVVADVLAPALRAALL